jgi:endonuclease/exonuclease/phosphatase family metal-dependent hydrolase
VSTRFIFLAPRYWIWGLALWLAQAPIRAAPIRVTTWNLQPAAAAGAIGGPNEWQSGLVQEAAESLKTLNPDVILLQQVADWDTCRQLAQALQPEIYQMVICSSFRQPGAKALGRQVAILSKTKAYLAWSEPWRNGGPSPAAPGGFAFAAMRLGGKNLGLLSVQLSDGADLQKASDESVRQLVQQIISLQNWRTNRLQAFLAAGEFNSTPDDPHVVHEKNLGRLEQIGFENALAGMPPENRVTGTGHAQRPAATLDYIFTLDAGRVSSPIMTRSVHFEHDAITCEIDLDAPKLAPAAPPPALASASPPAGSRQDWMWMAGALAGCLGLLILARKLARRSLAPLTPAALPNLTANNVLSINDPHLGPVIVATPSQDRMPEALRAGVMASFARWLQQKMVRRLVSDRAQLLATQQVAALKLRTVDERLSKIEGQIQQINQEYEQRIDALLKELITAKEENRELIRAKIVLVKAEMEKARLKAG